MTGDGTLDCKCGSDVPEEMVDIGHAWNWPLFPIAALRFGDTGHNQEAIHFRIGPLICEQGKWSEKKNERDKINHINNKHRETALKTQFQHSMMNFGTSVNIIAGVRAT